jgi:hypothetical protein
MTILLLREIRAGNLFLVDFMDQPIGFGVGPSVAPCKTGHLEERGTGEGHGRTAVAAPEQPVAHAVPFGRPGCWSIASGVEIEEQQLDVFIASGNGYTDAAEEAFVIVPRTEILGGERRFTALFVNHVLRGDERIRGGGEFVVQGAAQVVEMGLQSVAQAGPLGAGDLTDPSVLQNRKNSA